MNGSTIVEMDASGVIKGHRGMTCGRAEGFSYKLAYLGAALFVLIIPDFTKGF